MSSRIRMEFPVRKEEIPVDQCYLGGRLKTLIDQIEYNNDADDYRRGQLQDHYIHHVHSPEHYIEKMLLDPLWL